MAQFFSPDPYIQSPGNWYNYNRYAYGLNNPLLYNDPSGYFIKKFGSWLEEKFDDLGDWMVKHNISVGAGINMTPGGGPMTYTADINGQQVFNSANGNQYDPAVNVYRGLSDAMLSQGIVDGGVASFGMGNNNFAIRDNTRIDPSYLEGGGESWQDVLCWWIYANARRLIQNNGAI